MRPKKVLLVDDSRTTLLMEEMILRKGSFELVTASNGREAIEVALEERPDLILLDVVMPEMNGFDACRELRSLDATRTIPIIMVTTRGETEHVEAGYEAGCTDYVTKPINSLELMAKVNNYLNPGTEEAA